MRSLVKSMQMITSERCKMENIISEIQNKLDYLEKQLRETTIDHNLKQYYVGEMSGLRIALNIIRKERHYES